MLLLNADGLPGLEAWLLNSGMTSQPVVLQRTCDSISEKARGFPQVQVLEDDWSNTAAAPSFISLISCVMDYLIML